MNSEQKKRGEFGFAGSRSLAPVNKVHERNIIQYSSEFLYVQSFSHWILSNLHETTLGINI
ncbi:hypothetical protein LEP1GSC132_3571 [Leptospira kirschneri str. 200803703]|nr:hypothetical protein LEP1GSC132_3571 [Leptospira kirschneri str. 200803703]